MQYVSFDENSCPTLTADFDWDAVDHVEPTDTKEHSACEAMQRIWAWVYQPPLSDLDGFLCRCIIMCWVFVPELQDYSMTEMAARYGKKKQSLGRWVDDLKITFPLIAKQIQHLRE